MDSFVLPHEVHGDGAHPVFAVHGWFAGRSACAAVPPGLDRTAFTCAPAGRLGRARFSAIGPATDGDAGVAGSEVPAPAVAGGLGPALAPAVLRETWTSFSPRGRPVPLPGAGHCATGETPPEPIRLVEDSLREGGPA